MPARSIQSRTAQVCCAHLSLIIGLSVFELPRAPISSICLVYYLSMEYTEERGGDVIILGGKQVFPEYNGPRF